SHRRRELRVRLSQPRERRRGAWRVSDGAVPDRPLQSEWPREGEPSARRLRRALDVHGARGTADRRDRESARKPDGVRRVLKQERRETTKPRNKDVLYKAVFVFSWFREFRVVAPPRTRAVAALTRSRTPCQPL